LGGFAFFARQTRLRYDLVLAERSRLAREMHDTVIQGCVGVATLLEASAGYRPVDTAQADRYVDQARIQVTTTLEEAREAIWNP
jgi:signal transduction histidine kinase